MRILIVSSDSDTRVIFGVALRTAGYDVSELATADDIEGAAAGCDLVITNYPTFVDGARTVTETLRHSRVTRQIKILNATTHVTAADIDGATKAGVDATIILPAFPARVVDRVRSLLANGSGETGLPES